MPARRSQSPQNMQFRVDRAAALQLEGKTIQEIADDLDVSTRMISGYLSRARQQWKERRETAEAEKKDRELAVLEHIRKEALDGWHRSKKPTKETNQRIEQIVDANGQSVGTRKSIVTAKNIERVGDANFLATALSASNAIRGMEGIDAPTEMNVGVQQMGDHARLLHRNASELDEILAEARAQFGTEV